MKTFEITEEQLKKIIDKVGETEIVKIIPNALVDKFDEAKIYIYDGRYKLHRVSGDIYALISMTDSNSWANGTSSADRMIRYAKENKGLMVFDNYKEYIKWAYDNINS